MGDFKQRRLAAAPRVLHPSEDLSELPPLRSVVAGQVYHYRLAGSSQNSLPKPLLAGWVRSSPYWAVFIQKICTGGLRASAKSLFPHRVLPTDVLLNRIFTFQRTTEVNVPLFNPTENRVLSTLFSKIFLFFLLPDSQTSVQRCIRNVQAVRFLEMTCHSQQTIGIVVAVLVSALRVQVQTPASL